MVIMSESWSEYRYVCKQLTETLKKAGLEVNVKKSEVMSSRNTNLPKDESDWNTDVEDTEDWLKAKMGAVGSLTNPVALDE